MKKEYRVTEVCRFTNKAHSTISGLAKNGKIPAERNGTRWVIKGTKDEIIEAVNKTSGAFGQEDVELLEALARWAAIAIDNAQLYQAEHELRRLVEQSRVQLTQSEKLAATGRLAATWAHEVNNPLQAIYNCLQMMRSTPFRSAVSLWPIS